MDRIVVVPASRLQREDAVRRRPHDRIALKPVVSRANIDRQGIDRHDPRSLGEKLDQLFDGHATRERLQPGVGDESAEHCRPGKGLCGTAGSGELIGKRPTPGLGRKMETQRKQRRCQRIGRVGAIGQLDARMHDRVDRTQDHRLADILAQRAMAAIGAQHLLDQLFIGGTGVGPAVVALRVRQDRDVV